MAYYLHTFEVTMVVEDVREARGARHWVESRLDGGDAGFSVTHRDARKLTREEADAYYSDGTMPR